MKDSEVYLRAAELIEGRQEEFSCHAISVALGIDRDEEVDCHKKYLKTIFGRSRPLYLLSVHFDNYYEDAKDFRVLALCFMAAIAKSEGR